MIAETLKSSKLMRAFARHAGVIAGAAGIGMAALQSLNRTVKHGAPVMDGMTLSGLFLMASCLAMLPARIAPAMKRVSGALGLPYVGLLLADGYGKAGFAGLAANCMLPTAICLAMVFEKNAKPAPREAAGPGPVFWTSVAAVALRPFSIHYGAVNDEMLFTIATGASVVENLAVGMTDNKVQRFFFPQAPRVGGA